MAVASAALVTSPGGPWMPCSPCAPRGILKTKWTLVPSKDSHTLAASPGLSVFTLSITALANGGPAAPGVPRKPCSSSAPLGIQRTVNNTLTRDPNPG